VACGRKERRGERASIVASTMQCTRVSRLERCCISGMRKEEVSERMFVASTMQRTRVTRLERCCISGMRKEEVSGEGLLHQRCNALGLRGWRDVASVDCPRVGPGRTSANFADPGPGP
jgi:hypothetical protein